MDVDEATDDIAGILGGAAFVTGIVFGPWIVLAATVRAAIAVNRWLGDAAPGTPVLLAGVVLGAALGMVAIACVLGRLSGR